METTSLSQINNFDIIKRSVAISDINLEMYSIAGTNKLLDSIIPEDFNEDDRLPYWAEIWHSSIALSEYIFDLNLKGKNILEIGCGLGLVGIVAALKGANVLMTDYEQDALEIARENISVNLTGEQNIKTSYIDWRYPNLTGKYDLILGSDVIYEIRNHLPILKLIEVNLKMGGTAIISDPNRMHLPKFCETAESRGFNIDVSNRAVNFNNRLIDAAILSLNYKQSNV